MENGRGNMEDVLGQLTVFSWQSINQFKQLTN